MSKVMLSLTSILEAIEKIENYTQEFSSADEIWDIIKNKIKPLKSEIENLISTL